MKLVLYNNYSELNKLNKNIVKIIELEGDLRESSSLIEPSILIELNPSSTKSYVVDDSHNYVIYNGLKITWNSFVYDYVLSANYVYIQEFNRYYFITDIISVRTNMWRLVMRVDTLMSYKTPLLNLEAFVNRNEFIYDSMVKDDLISFYYDKDVIEYIPTKGDKVNTTFNPNQNIINDTIVINVINEDVGLNFGVVSPPDESLPIVRASTSGNDMTSKTYVTYPVEITHLSRRIQDDDTLASFILSLVVYPFVIPNLDNLRILKLGDTELTDTGTPENPNNDEVYVDDLSIQMSLYHIIADFTISKEDFMSYEPYSQYEIYIPYLGWINLSADDILDCRLIVYYVVNYSSGSAQVNVYDTTHNKLIYTGNCQLGVKLGINSTNNREVNDNRNSNNIALGVGLITSALSVATLNPLAIAGGIIGAGKTIANYIQNQNTNYSRASGSINSGLSGLYTPQDVKIRITRLKPKNYDENYAKLYGKPLNKYMKLSELNGFTILGDIHIEDIGSITTSEFEELYALLTNGFII